MCISEKLNTSKLMKIATLPIVPTWDSSRTRLRLWMMQQLEWSLLSFYSFFLPSSIFGLLCQVIKHSNIHSLWPITRKNFLHVLPHPKVASTHPEWAASTLGNGILLFRSQKKMLDEIDYQNTSMDHHIFGIRQPKD